MKKIHILMLSVLLIFQTLLAPISTLAAELSTVNEANQPTSAPVTPLEANDGTTEATIEGTTGDSSTSETTTPPVKDETSEPSQEQPEVKPTETSEAEATQGEENTTPEAAEDKADEDALNAISNQDGSENISNPNAQLEVKTSELKLGEQVIKDLSAVEVKNGQKIAFTLKIEAPAGHAYKEGSTFEYPIDASLGTYLTGTLTEYPLMDGAVNYGTVTASNNKLIFTFTDQVLSDSGGKNFWAFVNAEFTLKNESTETKQTIVWPGEQTLVLNYKPTGGAAITKKALTPEHATPVEYVEWQVDVNTNLAATSNQAMIDTLTGSHTFDASNLAFEVKELSVALNGELTEGSVVNITPQVVDKTLTVAGLDATKAYRITYQTKMGDPEDNEQLVVGNTATYNGGSAAATTTVKYGKALEKKVVTKPNGSSLETEWKINVNHNQRPLTPDMELVDSWGEGNPQVIKDFKVTKLDGTVDGTVVDNYTDTPSESGFTFKFKEATSDAYTITYTTTPKNPVTKDYTLYNNVKFNDKESNASVKYSTTTHSLNKTGVVDYATKEIEWTIQFNQAGYTLPVGTTLTDTFGDEGDLQLVGDVSDIAVTGIDQDTKTPPTITKEGKGFKIILNEETKKPIIVTYTTSYGIKNIIAGAGRNVDFTNTATLSKSPINQTMEAVVEVDDKQKGNGYKSGKYDYESKKINWTLGVNYNSNTLANAIVTDTVDATQKIENVKVYEATVDKKGDASKATEVTPESLDVKDNAMTITLGKINSPYIITYDTVDADGFLDVTKGNLTINNKAELKDGEIPNAEYTARAEIKHVQPPLKKFGDQQGTTPFINWNFEFNYAQTDLSNVVITDTVAKADDGKPTQIILEDTFKVYKVKLDANNKHPQLLAKENYELAVNNENGTFTLDLGNVTGAYYVEYQTIFLGASGEEANNSVSVSYTQETGYIDRADSNSVKMNFGAGAGSKSYNLVAKKIDAATGDPLAGVTFNLRGQYTGERILATKTTDEEGFIDFDMKLAGGTYTLEEVEAPDGYDELTNRVSVTLNDDTKEYKGKKIVVIDNVKKGQQVCDQFTLQATDADGKPVTEITLTNNVTGVVITKTITEGKITLDRATDTPGNYEVTAKTQSGKTITFKDVKVTYGQCGTVVQIQQDKVCTTFKVTIKGDVVDAKGNVIDLEGKEITVIEKATGTETKVTVTNKTFTMPKDAAIGEYAVKYGTQFLGNVTVSYVDCEAELTIAQTCPIFTVTLNNINGKPIKDKSVIVKKDTTVVGNKTYKTDAQGQITLNSLEPGEYTVYEADGTTVVGTFVTDDCQAVIQPKVADKCPKFEIKVDDPNNVLKTPVSKLVLKEPGTSNNTYEVSKDKDGKFIFDTTTMTVPAGTYNVYDGNLFLGTVEVDYEGGCEATLTLTQAPTCPEFTLTLKDVNGNPRDNVTVTLTDEAGALVEVNGDTNFTTNGNGQIKIDNRVIKAGKYVVKEGSNVLGEVTVGNTCEATIQPQNTTPPITVCEHYTIKVTGLGDNENTPRPGAEVVLKDKAGTTVVTGTTDKDGKVVFPREDLQVGEYTLYVDGAHIKVITVTIFDCQINVVAKQPAPSCPQVTVTLKDENGKARPNVDVMIKDSEGKTVATGTTDKDGKVTTEQPLTPGKYVVYEGDKKVGEFTKDATNCEYEVTTTPAPTCPQVTITVTDKDGKARKDVDITIKDAKDKVVLTGFTNDEGKLTTGKPLPKGKYIVYEVDKKVGEFVVDGTNCEFDVTTTEKPEEPNCDKPEPGQPTDPDCEEEPNKPGEGGENPVDPNNPGEGGENPVDPNNPGTDGGKPVDPNNPNQGGGDGGKPVDPNNPNQNGTDGGKPVDPNNPNQNGSDNGKPVNPNKPGTDHNTTNDGKNPNKLPQTDGASNTIFVYIGLVLMAISAFIFFRRKATAK